MIPNPPVSNLDPLVMIRDSLASQVEFVKVSDKRHQFSVDDCILYGDERFLVGVQFCLAHDLSLPGSVVAGQYGRMPIRQHSIS